MVDFRGKIWDFFPRFLGRWLGSKVIECLELLTEEEWPQNMWTNVVAAVAYHVIALEQINLI